MAKGLHTSTLDDLLLSELGAAEQMLGDVAASGPTLVMLNLAYESVRRALDLQRQIRDRLI